MALSKEALLDFAKPNELTPAEANPLMTVLLFILVLLVWGTPTQRVIKNLGVEGYYHFPQNSSDAFSPIPVSSATQIDPTPIGNRPERIFRQRTGFRRIYMMDGQSEQSANLRELF